LTLSFLQQCLKTCESTLLKKQLEAESWLNPAIETFDSGVLPVEGNVGSLLERARAAGLADCHRLLAVLHSGSAELLLAFNPLARADAALRHMESFVSFCFDTLHIGRLAGDWTLMLGARLEPLTDRVLRARLRALYERAIPAAQVDWGPDDPQAKRAALWAAAPDDQPAAAAASPPNPVQLVASSTTTQSVVDASDAKTCALCGKPALNRCSRCKIAYYCNTAHQKEHWPTHARECKTNVKK